MTFNPALQKILIICLLIKEKDYLQGAQVVVMDALREDFILLIQGCDHPQNIKCL